MTTHDSDVPGHDGESGHPATGDQGADHGHDDHAAGEVALGPIDWFAWGAGLLGVILGAVVTLAFVLATQPTSPV